MMVAKEVHTVKAAIRVIARTEGVEDQQWHDAYKGAAGGIITYSYNSEETSWLCSYTSQIASTTSQISIDD